MARKKSSTQIWLEYIPVRVLFAIWGALPRKAALRAGEFLGRLGYRFAGGLRRVALRNLEIAFPEKSLTDRETIARASFENLGRVLGELTQFPRATPESLRRLIEYEFDADESQQAPEQLSF